LIHLKIEVRVKVFTERGNTNDETIKIHRVCHYCYSDAALDGAEFLSISQKKIEVIDAIEI
jgi:hypothetical protein